MDGILIIDKPADWTSHDVVGKLRRLLKTKRIGHTGTLDPFATGVLVMLVGQATRLAQFLDKDVKEYVAKVRLGFETTTGDLTGERRDAEMGRQSEAVIESEIQAVLADFRGQIEQIPPMYSAKKVDGKKLYELARKGIEIERKPVNVIIYDLEVQSSKFKVQSSNEVMIRVSCSAGTYIRTLAEDIGRKLGTGAHLTALRRTCAGKFDLSKALTIEDLEKVVLAEKLDDYLISMNQSISHLPEKKLDEIETIDIKHGRNIGASFVEKDVQTVRLTDALGNLLAIGNYVESEKLIKPRIVFAN